MKKLLLALAFSLFAQAAWAQNPTCPTRPFGDNSNACASTAFVAQNAIPNTTCSVAGGFPVFQFGTTWVCSTVAGTNASLAGTFTISGTGTGTLRLGQTPGATNYTGIFPFGAPSTTNYSISATSDGSDLNLYINRPTDGQMLFKENGGSAQVTLFPASTTPPLGQATFAVPINVTAVNPINTTLAGGVPARTAFLLSNTTNAGGNNQVGMVLDMVNNQAGNNLPLFAGVRAGIGSVNSFALNLITEVQLGNTTAPGNWIAEFDGANNSGADFGNTAGYGGLATPLFWSLNLTGAGTNNLTSAIIISYGGAPRWNRGITYDKSSTIQADIETYSTSLTSYSDRGVRNSTLDFTNATRPIAWSGATTYAIGNAITSGGNIYASIQAGNLNHVPPNTTWWSLVGSTSGLTAGWARTANNDPLLGRNAANNADISLLNLDASNVLNLYGTQATITSAGTVGATIFNAATGFEIAGAAASGTFLRGNGTNYVASSLTIVNSATSGGVAYFSSTSALASSGLMTANAFITGGGAGIAPNAVAITGLVLGNGASAPTAYAGTSCTNQFIRSLSAAGIATCASVANTDLINSSVTYGTTTVALGSSSTSIAGLTAITPTSDGGADLGNSSTRWGTTFTNAITASGQAARIWSMAANVTSSTIGQNLTILAGGSGAGTDLSGGGLILSAGAGTGTGGTIATTFIALYAPISGGTTGSGVAATGEMFRAFMGPSSYGYICFRTTSCTTTTYALSGATADAFTYLNAASGGGIKFNINGSLITTIDANGYAGTAVTDATSTSTGAIRNPGGMSVNKRVFMNGLSTDAAATDRSICQDTTSFEIKFGSGAAGICLGTSSARYKELIEPMGFGLSEIKLLQPKSFFYKKGYGDDGARQQFGFLAEDVFKIEPRWVGLDVQGRPNSVDWPWMLPAMVNAVKDIDARLSVLEKRRAK